MNKSAIKERLASAGIAAGVSEIVCQKAFYAARNGEDIEDFLQEAIATALEGCDIKSALTKINNSHNREVSLEVLKTSDDEEGEWDDVLEKKTTDSERPDWIPDQVTQRLSLFTACLIAIDRSYRQRSKQEDGYLAYLYLLKRQQIIGYFSSSKQAGCAERVALRKIMGWINPADDETFTASCTRCGGPKSIGAVSKCRQCYLTRN